MAIYIKGGAVTGAETYELYEKVVTPKTVLGEEQEYLSCWTTCKGELGNTNYFAQKNRWSTKVHVSKFHYYNGGEDTISCILLLYNTNTLTITKRLDFATLAAGANSFDVDFDLNPDEGFIVRVSKNSYYMDTPASENRGGLTIITADTYNVGGTVELGLAIPSYTICTSLTVEEYEKSTTEFDTEYNLEDTASEINFEVSALGLSEGEHTFVVKAKADGYADSDYSNEVVYTQT